MAAQNSGGSNTPQEAASKRRQNSYEKPLTPAPDIQQPGEAGDFGNGAETGHTKPPAPDAASSRDKSKNIPEGAAGSPRLPKPSDDEAPDQGAEPSNPYSGT
jgi:hypothetical protein